VITLLALLNQKGTQGEILQVGDIISVSLSGQVNPSDQSVIETENQVIKDWEISKEGASYVAVHFSHFLLLEQEELLVFNGQGEQQYILTGQGKNGSGGAFWAQPVHGSTIILQLRVPIGSDLSQSRFNINEEAFSFTAEDHEPERQLKEQISPSFHGGSDDSSDDEPPTATPSISTDLPSSDDGSDDSSHDEHERKLKEKTPPGSPGGSDGSSDDEPPTSTRSISTDTPSSDNGSDDSSDDEPPTYIATLFATQFATTAPTSGNDDLCLNNGEQCESDGGCCSGFCKQKEKGNNVCKNKPSIKNDCLEIGESCDKGGKCCSGKCGKGKNKKGKSKKSDKVCLPPNLRHRWA